MLEKRTTELLNYNQFRMNFKMIGHDVLLNEIFLSTMRRYPIDVLAPASGLSGEIRQHLASLPLQVSIVPSYVMPCAIPYHAEEDNMRCERLIEALYRDVSPHVLWMLRGGYGSARLIPQLLKQRRPQGIKTLIGFSDITALHVFMSQHWGVRAIHGCGYAQLLDQTLDPYNFIRLAELLSGSAYEHRWHLEPMNEAAAHVSEINGPICGGNLTILTTSIGTVWQVKTDHAILCLEEVGEKGYRLDRLLTHLTQSGLCDHVKAIILGACLGEDEHVIQIAKSRFAQSCAKPVYETQEIGHGRVNYPWIYGANVSVVDSKGRYEMILRG